MSAAGRSAPLAAAVAAYAQAPRPRAATRWREAALCVVDLETTGLDPARDAIVSFAAIPIDGGRIRVGDALHHLVRPDRALPAASIRIHGIRPADLAGAPALPEVLPELVRALTGRLLVAHAAWIERAFLRAPLRAAGVSLPRPALDTTVLARGWLGEEPGQEGSAPALAGLARRLGLPVHRQHHALGDALTTAQVFLALAAHLDARRPQTVGSLAHGGRTLGERLTRRLRPGRERR